MRGRGGRLGFAVGGPTLCARWTEGPTLRARWAEGSPLRAHWTEGCKMLLVSRGDASWMV